MYIPLSIKQIVVFQALILSYVSLRFYKLGFGQHFRNFVDPKIGTFVPLPMPFTGECKAGVSYTITRIEQLYELVPDIECVWTQGVVPSKVPLGAAYGRLLTFLNTASLNLVSEFIYQGDYIVETQCNGKHMKIGILNFGGLDLSTGIWTVDRLPPNYNIVSGEVYNGEVGILMDFTINVEEYCPYEGNEANRWAQLKGFLPFQTGTWPYNIFIDMLRVVGRDEDECVILLGRTWMTEKNWFEETSLATVLFFTLKSCDPTLNPNFVRGQALQPLQTSYTYNRKGAYEFIKRIEIVSYSINKIPTIGQKGSGLWDYANMPFNVTSNEDEYKNNLGRIKDPKVYETFKDFFWHNPVFQAWESMGKALSSILQNNN